MILHALHLEFKEGGRIGQSGPGDTLRLFHALRHFVVGKKLDAVRVITTTEPGLLEGALRLDAPAPQPDFVYVPPQDGYAATSGGVDDGALGAFLAQTSVDWSVASVVVHAFIGKESYPYRERPLNIAGKAVERCRIDNGLRKDSLMHRGLAAFLDDKPDAGLAVAVPIRSLTTAPQLNTPAWFIECVRAACKKHRMSCRFYGLPKGEDFTKLCGEEGFGFRGVRLIEQIRWVHAEACCAIGFNSGGLDIAAAAGLPVLRIGEYQKNGPVLEPDEVRLPRKWGARYNSYLATAMHVGLEPGHDDASRFPQGIAEASIHAFLEIVRGRRDVASRPCHAILPYEVPLAVSTAEELLHEHDTSAPRRQ